MYVLKACLVTAMLLVCGACTDRKQEAEQTPGDLRQSAADVGDTDGIALAVEQWNTLSRELPQLIELAESRLEAATKKARTDAQRSALANTRASLEDLKVHWAQAASAFGSGQPIDAAARAQDLKRRVHDVLRELGIDLS